MGWQATGWAFKAPIPNPGAKFVLVALAERAGNENDHHDWTCYPSIETIADYTAQGYRTIQRHLDWLEEQGFISRERRTTAKGRKGAYNFTLHRNPIARDKMAGGQDRPDDRPNGASQVAQIGQTEPVIRTDQRTEASIEASAARAGTRLPEAWEPDANVAILIGLSHEEAADQLARFRDYWTAKPGKEGRKLDWTATWRNWCRNALERSNGRGSPVTRAPAAYVDYGAERATARLQAMDDGARQAVTGGRRRWGVGS